MEKQIKEIDIWRSIRENLNSNYEFSQEWTKAIELFDKRIKLKYLNPIKKLIINNERKGEGFVIVTIQCALIETFGAFKEGLIYNHNKPKEGGLEYEYKESGDLFVRFLNNEDVFKGIFFTEDKFGAKQLNTPFSGVQFYSKVRCGLMHEARTKGDWHINATLNDLPTDKKFIKQKAKGNVIYRTLFHYALMDYFNKYKSELRNTENNNLRRLFARKLDHLYDIKDDFEWWD